VQFLRQWRADTDQPAAIRILEADAVCVQEQTPEAEVLQLAVELLVPVLAVAGDRVARVGRVYTDLVRAAGEQAHLEQSREIAQELDRAEFAGCFLAVGGDTHRAFHTDAQLCAQGCVDALHA
jgi:hypothetical protein